MMDGIFPAKKRKTNDIIISFFDLNCFMILSNLFVKIEDIQCYNFSSVFSCR